MGIYRIGEPFKSIQEYCDYPHNRLYFHNKIIGKPITDNWQFRLICQAIQDKAFRKAELNEGYEYYNVNVTVFENDSWIEFDRTLNIIARSPLEAKSKAILKIINDYNLTDQDVDMKVDVYKAVAESD